MTLLEITDKLYAGEAVKVPARFTSTVLWAIEMRDGPPIDVAILIEHGVATLTPKPQAQSVPPEATP